MRTTYTFRLPWGMRGVVSCSRDWTFGLGAFVSHTRGNAMHPWAFWLTFGLILGPFWSNLEIMRTDEPERVQEQERQAA